jgi:hypothetical protein
MPSESTSRHTPFHVVRESLSQPGCPACRLGAVAAAKALAALAYESVTDVDVVERFQRSLGVCALHGWQWLESDNAAQAVAILYRAVLAHLIRALERADAPSADGAAGLLARVGVGRGAAAGLAAALEARGDCPACAARDQAIGRALEVLLDQLPQPETRAAYEASDGLCLPHLREALAGTRSRHRGAAAILAAASAERLRGLEAELAEYVRKHDYRFRDEPFGAERDAPARALGRVIGERGAL